MWGPGGKQNRSCVSLSALAECLRAGSGLVRDGWVFCYLGYWDMETCPDPALSAWQLPLGVFRTLKQGAGSVPQRMSEASFGKACVRQINARMKR